MQRQRPLGVTILGILAIIGGVLGILGSFAIIALGGASGTLGIISLVLSVVELILGVGFLTLQPWAWMLGVIFGVLSIVLAIVYIVQGTAVSSEVVGILIDAVILFYLFRPNVQQAFGRA